MFDKSAAAAETRATPAVAAAARRDGLRPMPNEDVHVFVKRIDNARVVREHDPKVNVSAWKTITLSCLSALLLVALIVPVANSYLAGYTLTELERENSLLEGQVARLLARESELTSLEALRRAAKNQKYLDPATDRMVVLENERTGSVALNRK
jgi:hypothetical protein